MNVYVGPVERISNRKQRRNRCDIDTEFRSNADLLPYAWKTAAKNYYTTALAAGLDPLNASHETVRAAYEFKAAKGGATAWPQSLQWTCALYRLSPEYKRKIKADWIPPPQRGKPRSVTPRLGEYPVLEEEINVVMCLASEPPKTTAIPKSSAVRRI